MDDKDSRLTFREFTKKYFDPGDRIETANQLSKKLQSILRLLNIDATNLKVNHEYSLTDRNQEFLYSLFEKYDQDREFKKIRLHKILYNSPIIDFVTNGFREMMEDAGKCSNIIETQTDKINMATDVISKELDALRNELKNTNKIIDRILATLSLNPDDKLAIICEMRQEYITLLKEWGQKWEKAAKFIVDYRYKECATWLSKNIESENYEIKRSIILKSLDLFNNQAADLIQQVTDLENRTEKNLSEFKKLDRLKKQQKKMYEDCVREMCKCYGEDYEKIIQDEFESIPKSSIQLVQEEIKKLSRS